LPGYLQEDGASERIRISGATGGVLMEAFDYVVVGGGPGGCVTAARLTENPSVTVALIEAGPDRRGFLDDCTAAGTIFNVPRKTPSNYAFDSTPQAGLNNRRSYQPHGRGLGGGSAINVLMYMRGHSSDYDEWAAMGSPGWSFAEVLPYFRKSENNQTHRDRYHGNDGPLWVEELRTDSPYHAIIRRACTEAGLPFNPDFNGAEQEGFNLVQVMMKNGERFHTGKAFIRPHLGKRANLHLYTDTECTRILFEGKRAVGVEVIAGGEKWQISARREVVVAGGGFLSPKLLMLSGVGAGAELQRFGIAVVHDLPGVGKNLMDHLDFILGYHIPGDPNLIAVSPIAGLQLAKAYLRWRRERRGMLATNYAEVTGFMRLTPESPKPEIQYEFLISILVDHGRELTARHGMSCHVLLLHPKSRGTVALASPDHRDAPLLDLNYLAHPDDLKTIVEGTKRTDAIFKTPTFRRLVKRDLFTAHCRSDEDWADVIRNRAGTNYHPVGTCRMGQGGDAVVDARLRVHGMEGLRVVDGSIMPRIVGGNTMAPVIMIAEKGADMIKEDWH
jgi:choline dehydrogenase-like flavoprotein